MNVYFNPIFGRFLFLTIDMKLSFFLLLLYLITGTQVLHSQNTQNQRVDPNGKKYILHQVKEGETIFGLCKTYHTSQEELVAANPDLNLGLKTGSTIKIPASQEPEFIEINVKRKQTVFSIARQYGITLEELYKYNPSAKKGILADQILRIPVHAKIQAEEPVQPAKPDVQEAPAKPAQKQEIRDNAKYFTHKIKPGETLFDLEKKYRIPQDSLLAMNPQLQKENLSGSVIRIPESPLSQVISKPKNENEFIRYTVRADESVYDIAARFGLSISEMKNTNPELEYRELRKGEELLLQDKSLQKKVFDENTQDSIWIFPEYKIIHRYPAARNNASQPRETRELSAR